MGYLEGAIRALQSSLVFPSSHETIAASTMSSRFTRVFSRAVFSRAAVARSYVEVLPTEVLTEIFIQSLPSLDDEYHYDSLASKSPVVLTAVCRSWREIALDTPELWRSLELLVPRDVRRHPSISPGIKSWFSHATTARTHALSLNATFFPGGFESTLLASAVPWSRITHLTLSDPLLSPHALLEIFAQCTQLQTCRITCLGFDQHIADPLVGYSYPTLELPHLKSLIIDFTHLPMSSGPSPLTFRRPTRISPLLELLSLPALETLELRASTAGSDDPYLIPVLWAHQHSTHPPLTRLVLGRILFSTDHMRILLGATTSLQHLHLAAADNRPHMYPALVQQLAYHPALINSNILPNLTSLIIEDNFPPRPSDAALLDVIESRRWDVENYPHGQPGLAMLKKVAVFWDYDRKRAFNADAAERVTKLHKGGLRICYPTLQGVPRVDVGSLRVSAGMNPYSWGFVLGSGNGSAAGGETFVDYL